MKKLLIIMLMLAPMAAFAQKFGHFNSMEIIQLMPEYAKMQTDLKSQQEKYEKEIQSMQEELKKNYEEIQNLAKDTPEAIRNRKMQSFSEQQQKIEDFVADCRQELAKSERDMSLAMRDKLLKAVKEVGTNGDYVYIMDVSGGIPFISDKHSKDVTADVKQKLGL